MIGLVEDQEKSTVAIVQEFLTEKLGLKNISIKTALRLGTQAGVGSGYSRPIVIRFNKLPQRNLVWRKIGAVTRLNENNENGNTVRIQADLPKVLREGMQTLYKVVNAASNIKGFESVKVHDYQLELNQQTYQITDLETLPLKIRPSTLAEI